MIHIDAGPLKKQAVFAIVAPMSRRAAGRGMLAWLAGAILLTGLSCAAAIPFVVGWWLDFSQEPQPSDIIVVLCGGEFSRALYAAELYQQGWGPEVWLVRPRKSASISLAASLGVAVPSEDDIFYKILLLKGVPRDRIRRYGEDAVSTLGEAQALKGALDARGDTRGKRILLVTSRYHARRANMVFRKVLPDASLRVAASPYDPFDRRWWRDRGMVWSGFLEMTKTLCYLTSCPLAQSGVSARPIILPARDAKGPGPLGPGAKGDRQDRKR